MKQSVSVIIPTLNRSTLLVRCVESLLSQSIPPYEIIIVDNSPNQSAKETIADIRHTPIKLRYVSEKHRGVAFARNSGIRHVRGDVVALIDDDCLAMRDWIKKGILASIKNPNKIIVGESMPQDTIVGYLDHYLAQSVFEYIRAGVVKRVDTKNCFIPRRVLDHIRLFDTKFLSYFEDLDWSNKLQEQEVGIVFDPTIQVVHRGPQNIMRLHMREVAKGRDYYHYHKKWGHEIRKIDTFSSAEPTMKKLLERESRRKKKRLLSIKRKIFLDKPLYYRLLINILLTTLFVIRTTSYMFTFIKYEIITKKKPS